MCGLGPLGRAVSAVLEHVEANVALHHLGHEAVHRTPAGRNGVQDDGGIALLAERALDPST